MEEQPTIFQIVWSSSAPVPYTASCCAPVDLGLNGHSHISPFLFTKTLLPVMKKTALEPGSDVRIVNVRAVHMTGGIPSLQGQVSSVAHRWVPNPRYDSLEAFNNDFSTTYKPKTNVYGKSVFSWPARVICSRRNGSWQGIQNSRMCSGRPNCNGGLMRRRSRSQRCLYTQATLCQVGLPSVSGKCDHLSTFCSR